MRIDAAHLAALKPELTELIKNMEIGDVLKGRVLEALANSISIRMTSGQIISAVLSEGASVPKGAFVELLVNNIDEGGKIYAEFKSEGKVSDMDSKISDLLKQINLPLDEKNVEAAKLLIKYRLPVVKEAITNITGLQKSIDNLNNSSEGRVGLLLSGLDIKNTPVDVLNKIVLNWSPEMIVLESEENAPILPQNSQVVEAEGEEGKLEIPKGEPTGMKKTEQTAVKEENIVKSLDNSKEPVAMPKSKGTEIHMENNRQIDINNEGAPRNPVKGREVSIEIDKGAEEVNKGAALLKELEKLGIETGSEVKRFAGQVGDILSAIKNTDMEALTYLASKDMEATPKNLGLLIKNIENKEGISHFLDKLQLRLEIEENPELKEIKDSIKKIFIEPRQVEDSKEVSEQLKDIAKLGEKLENYLSKSGIKDPEIRDTLSNLKDNIDFVKNINEHNNFVQLPIIINGDKSTAKLYIYKEGKRSKAINPENTTILLALDLKSLGHLESMIGIKEKLVNITFRVANSGIGSIIEKQSSILKSALMEKGYSLSPVKVINLEQPFNLLTLEAMINQNSSDKIHFDMRV